MSVNAEVLVFYYRAVHFCRFLWLKGVFRAISLEASIQMALPHKSWSQVFSARTLNLA